MKFEVLGQPQGKQRVKATVRGGFAKVYTPADTISYENKIYSAYIQAQEQLTNKLWDEPLKITLTAFYSIPKSFSKKKVAAALAGLIRPLVKPDIDNIVKVVCDALNSVAYHDDKQIIKIVTEKFYSNEPKLVIEIEEFKIEN